MNVNNNYRTNILKKYWKKFQNQCQTKQSLCQNKVSQEFFYRRFEPSKQSVINFVHFNSPIELLILWQIAGEIFEENDRHYRRRFQRNFCKKSKKLLKEPSRTWLNEFPFFFSKVILKRIFKEVVKVLSKNCQTNFCKNFRGSSQRNCLTASGNKSRRAMKIKIKDFLTDFLKNF